MFTAAARPASPEFACSSTVCRRDGKIRRWSRASIEGIREIRKPLSTYEGIKFEDPANRFRGTNKPNISLKEEFEEGVIIELAPLIRFSALRDREREITAV